MPTIRSAKQKAQGILYKTFLGDRRCRVYDLSRIKPEERKSHSPVIQFYSSVDNVGNYTPVLGIHKMLSHTADTWCIHDKNIDFDFINTNYKCVIIGGAGLLHECFEPFWANFLETCKLPTIIWGVGVCLPDSTGVRVDLKDSTANTGVDRKLIADIAKRCDLINVRDDLTADYYHLNNANISACPTIAYLEDFTIEKNSQTVLYSSHEELVSESDKQEIKATIAQTITKFKYTDNIQRTFLGLNDIISNYYCKSKLVITSRLHGAIFAYGLGIPYIAFARDAKMRAFCSMYGNGLSVQNTLELKEIIKKYTPDSIILKPIAIKPILEFGKQARSWVASNCSELEL
jgi:Polysaccharide pyruvyl transferase